VRSYNGILVLNNKPIAIKEYLLLDRDFNAKEIRERKEKFAYLANLNLRNGGGQDFRLVTVCEAIASPNSNENCCYLISDPIPHSQSLRQYLATSPPFPPEQVRQILNQVLQTLWFLHHQKIRLPNGEIQHGLPHGNLSLDSLLIVSTSMPNQQAIATEHPFFIYLTDLALWEHLFLPPALTPSPPTLSGDLVDLGYSAFDLLTGDFSRPSRPNLLLEQPWTTVADQPLKQFIRQLVSGEFKADVEAARQALLHLPAADRPSTASPTPLPNVSTSKSDWNLWHQLLLWGLVGGWIGVLLWVGGLLIREPPTDNPLDTPCCLTKIAIPDRPVTYITETGGIWIHILRTPQLVAFDRTLEQVLQDRAPRLNQYSLQTTEGNALDALRSGVAEFALTEWQEDLPEGFEQQEVAYDGLVVVVAFGDERRFTTVDSTQLFSVPQILQGRISIEQLHQLYTGEQTSWTTKNSTNLPIRLYRPIDRATIEHFEQVILQGSPAAIERFRNTAIDPLPTNQMFSEILKDFEQRHTIGIGFARLSQVINQCSVYPLAIGEDGQEVQPFEQRQGGAIDPTTDLCGDKGSYQANPTAFTTARELLQRPYPLRQRLVVIYPKQSQAGRQFAAALQTDEGQALLTSAGLVPIRSLRDR
jgi:ABC-type phosphate transport system substrate-binding protein